MNSIDIIKMMGNRIKESEEALQALDEFNPDDIIIIESENAIIDCLSLLIAKIENSFYRGKPIDNN